jgi:hypothetical protein
VTPPGCSSVVRGTRNSAHMSGFTITARARHDSGYVPVHVTFLTRNFPWAMFFCSPHGHLLLRQCTVPAARSLRSCPMCPEIGYTYMVSWKWSAAQSHCGRHVCAKWPASFPVTTEQILTVLGLLWPHVAAALFFAAA